jgi:hypothetical protein
MEIEERVATLRSGWETEDSTFSSCVLGIGGTIDDSHHSLLVFDDFDLAFGRRADESVMKEKNKEVGHKCFLFFLVFFTFWTYLSRSTRMLLLS